MNQDERLKLEQYIAGNLPKLTDDALRSVVSKLNSALNDHYFMEQCRSCEGMSSGSMSPCNGEFCRNKEELCLHKLVLDSSCEKLSTLGVYRVTRNDKYDILDAVTSMAVTAKSEEDALNFALEQSWGDYDRYKTRYFLDVTKCDLTKKAVLESTSLGF